MTLGVGKPRADWTRGKHTPDPGGINHLLRNDLCGPSTHRSFLSQANLSLPRISACIANGGGCWGLEVLVQVLEEQSCWASCKMKGPRKAGTVEEGPELLRSRDGNTGGAILSLRAPHSLANLNESQQHFVFHP